ncbi:MAG: hypothetical protein ACK5MY_00125 [Jhaorihella sp.]
MIRALTWSIPILALSLALAGCGADGEPQPPAPKQTAAPGLRVSGTARVGISVSRGAALPSAPARPAAF